MNGLNPALGCVYVVSRGRAEIQTSGDDGRMTLENLHLSDLDNG
jgi:hypothetical protein